MATPRKKAPQVPEVKGRAVKAVGQHDQAILACVMTLLSGKGEDASVTVKAVSEASNLRVRVLENTLWRLSQEGGKYSPPFLIRGKEGGKVVFTLAPEVPQEGQE